MRAIKFRVWDGESFTYPLIDALTGQMYYYDMAGCSGLLEQFTGLVDENGKGIYEGDIVKYGSETQYYESVVSYNEDMFIGKNYFYKSIYRDWEVVWDKKGLEAFNEGWYRQNMRLTGWNYIEVIGNIHENSDLLH